MHSIETTNSSSAFIVAIVVVKTMTPSDQGEGVWRISQFSISSQSNEYKTTKSLVFGHLLILHVVFIGILNREKVDECLSVLFLPHGGLASWSTRTLPPPLLGKNEFKTTVHSEFANVALWIDLTFLLKAERQTQSVGRGWA